MIERLLKYFHRENCDPAATPLPAGLELSQRSEDVLTEQTPNRERIGALFYL